MREGGTGARVSGLAHAHDFSSRDFKSRVEQPPLSLEGFTAGPSGSGAHASGREHHGVDDDDDVYDDDLITGICCGGSGGSVFCAVSCKPDTAASVKLRCEYEKFFLCIRSSRACAQIHALDSADFRNPANW